MLVARAVVDERHLALERLLRHRHRDPPRPGGRALQRGERPARVASGGPGDEPESVLVCLHLASEPCGESARRSSSRIVLLQRPERHHPGPAQERRVDLEARILGGGAEQGDGPALHVRQQRVLLRLVEAVDLVEEEHRALAVRPRALLGLRDRLADVLHPGRHRRHLDEGGLRRPREEPGQGRLPGAGRPPQDEEGTRSSSTARRSGSPRRGRAPGRRAPRARPGASARRAARPRPLAGLRRRRRGLP